MCTNAICVVLWATGCIFKRQMLQPAWTQGHWGISSCHYYTGQHCFPMSDSSICMWERVRHWERVSVSVGGDRASHCCVLTSKPVFGSHPTWPMCLENITLGTVRTAVFEHMDRKRLNNKNKDSLETENQHLICITSVTSCLHRKYWITHWKLLGVPMSAFVNFFLLPLTFFSFLLMLLWTMLFMWELLWKRMLFISGFLMSTVAIGRVGPGHMTKVISYRLTISNRLHTFPCESDRSRLWPSSESLCWHQQPIRSVRKSRRGVSERCASWMNHTHIPGGLCIQSPDDAGVVGTIIIVSKSKNKTKNRNKTSLEKKKKEHLHFIQNKYDRITQIYSSDRRWYFESWHIPWFSS